MDVSINSAINAYNNAAKITRASASPEETGTSRLPTANDSPFAALVEKSIGGSLGTLRKAESSAMANLTNKVDITDVITAVSKAESTLKSVIAIRDRLVSAFQEIEKMPI